MKSSLNEVQDKARQDATTSTPMVDYEESLSSYGGRFRIRKNLYIGSKKYLSIVHKQTSARNVCKSNTRNGTEDDRPDIEGDI